MKSMCIAFLGLMVCLLAACNKPTPFNNPPQPSEVKLPQVNEPTGTGEELKLIVERLFELAKAGDCTQMASMIAFRTNGSPEAWHRSLRYEDAAERIEADNTCSHLQVMVVGLEKHTFKDFAVEDESEGEWNIWTVELSYVDGSKDAQAFAFLKIGGRWLLGDID